MFSTLPTQIAGVLYLIFVVLFVVLFALHTSYWKPLLIILLMSIPYVLINIYDIDCVFSGYCDVWGWIKGILFIIYLVFTIILTILLLADFQNTINTAKETPAVIKSKDNHDDDDTRIIYRDKIVKVYPGSSNNSDISRRYVATSNCVFDSTSNIWSGSDCRAPKTVSGSTPCSANNKDRYVETSTCKYDSVTCTWSGNNCKARV